MVSAAVTCLPAAVSLLFLEVLFMQISRVSLPPGPAGFVYSEFFCVRASATCFPLSKHTGRGDAPPAFSGLHVCLQLTWEVGLPLSPVEFSSHCHFYKLSHSWLLGASLACPACLFTVPGRIPFPQSLALTVSHTLSRVSLLFLFVITQFLFSPQVEIGLSRELCCSGPGLSVCGNTTVLLSSPCPCLPKPSGRGQLVALLVSPFNVNWRCPVLAGGVEGSKFCLF
jgi:hypothetical protein